MNESQKQAIRCALLDLVGSKQAHDQNDIHAHDWQAHQLSINELEEAFADMLAEYENGEPGETP